MALAEVLGPPWKYEHRIHDSDATLREIELAELNTRFGGTHAHRLPLQRFDEALRSAPGDLFLHHKIWQLLIATRRRSDALGSYRAACERAQCDITNAAYHACVRSSTAFLPKVSLRLVKRALARIPALPSTNFKPLQQSAIAHDLDSKRRSIRNSHIIELPQPLLRPPSGILPFEKPGVSVPRYFAYNPAIVNLPITDVNGAGEVSAKPSRWVSPGDGDDAHVEPWNLSGLPPSQHSSRPFTALAPMRYVVFFRYSNVRSIWATTQLSAWQWDEPEWQENIDPGIIAAGLQEHRGSRPAAASRSDDAADASFEDAALGLSAVIEHAERKAQGQSTEQRWDELRQFVGNQSRDAVPAAVATSGASQPDSATQLATTEDSSDDIEIYDVVETPDGIEVPVLSEDPAASRWDSKPVVHAAPGGYSSVGYFVVERNEWGDVRVVTTVSEQTPVTKTHGPVENGSNTWLARDGIHWLRLSPPFAPCHHECSAELSLFESFFAWAPTLSPSACKLVAESPTLVMLLLTCLCISGFAQLHQAWRRTRTRGRLARLHLIRALLLLTATLPVRVCRANGSVDRCMAVRRRRYEASKAALNGTAPHANRTTAKLSNGSAAHVHANGSASRPGGSATLGSADDDWRSARTEASLPDDHDAPFGSRKWIEYDGFEDSRAVYAQGALHLLASHEDCEGSRRLYLVRLAGEAANGTLRQDAAWQLSVDDPPDFQLNDNEKNWSPFVVNRTLFLTYSIQPHIVLRCAWTGGSCRLVFNTSSDFLASAHDAFGQGLRGGTGYVPVNLPDGSHALLAAMHVKDSSHAPSFYATSFYLLDPMPPFRVRSLSPKVCLSEEGVELSSSARCALQYVVGLVVEPTSNLLLLSYGEFDRRMKLAALPLDKVIAFARSHELASGGEATVSECEAVA